MKRIAVGIIMLMIGSCIQAQNWEEWTQQKKTQKKYLLQQIAALNIYLGYAKEGYAIAGNGLTTIGKIKDGDFDLHDAKFDALRFTNPNIATSSKIVSIVAQQLKIIKEAKRTVDGVRESESFTQDEVDHAKEVLENLLSSCSQTVDELITLMKPSEYSMTDDERIKRIELLYRDTQTQYAFTVSYSMESGLLAAQRMNDKVNLEYSRGLK